MVNDIEMSFFLCFHASNTTVLFINSCSVQPQIPLHILRFLRHTPRFLSSQMLLLFWWCYCFHNSLRGRGLNTWCIFYTLSFDMQLTGSFLSFGWFCILCSGLSLPQFTSVACYCSFWELVGTNWWDMVGRRLASCTSTLQSNLFQMLFHLELSGSVTNVSASMSLYNTEKIIS